MRLKQIFTFFLLICTALCVQAGLFDKKQPEYLKADEAFQFQAKRLGDGVYLNWQIAEGYYLYQEKLEFNVNGDKNRLTAPIYGTAAEKYQDPYFGDVNIFKYLLSIALTPQGGNFNANDVLTVTYQGCTEGFCYPPETKHIKVTALPSITMEEIKALEQPKRDEAKRAAEEKSQQKTADIKANPPIAEQEKLAEKLLSNKFSIFWFFVLGLGLAFTPCVLPMLPLLSAIVIGKDRPNLSRAFMLSLVYVQGMALTYTLLGLIVASIGLSFQVALQNPYVLGTLSIIFILLALSMFGVFNLQLPSSLQTKLTEYSQKQKSGAFGGVFLMGMIAGLIASPCTTAPLSGALLYVAQTGDLLIGGLTLYLLALGMGLPLMLVTVFGNNILPRSGAWLENVKVAFGFVMLALPVFLLSRIFSPEWEPRLWAILSSAFFIWLALQMKNQGIGIFIKIVAFILAMICTSPLQTWLWNSQTISAMPQSAVENPVVFQNIKTYDELQTVLKNNSKPVMLDLYADWCVACKEFEKYTFPNPAVKKELESMLLLRIDMTENSPENKDLMDKLNVTGLPTIIFFNGLGKEIKGHRVTGFMDAPTFAYWLEKAKPR